MKSKFNFNAAIKKQQKTEIIKPVEIVPEDNDKNSIDTPLAKVELTNFSLDSFSLELVHNENETDFMPEKNTEYLKNNKVIEGITTIIAPINTDLKSNLENVNDFNKDIDEINTGKIEHTVKINDNDETVPKPKAKNVKSFFNIQKAMLKKPSKLSTDTNAKTTTFDDNDTSIARDTDIDHLVPIYSCIEDTENDNVNSSSPINIFNDPKIIETNDQAIDKTNTESVTATTDLGPLTKPIKSKLNIKNALLKKPKISVAIPKATALLSPLSSPVGDGKVKSINKSISETNEEASTLDNKNCEIDKFPTGERAKSPSNENENSFCNKLIPCSSPGSSCSSLFPTYSQSQLVAKLGNSVYGVSGFDDLNGSISSTSNNQSNAMMVAPMIPRRKRPVFKLKQHTSIVDTNSLEKGMQDDGSIRLKDLINSDPHMPPMKKRVTEKRKVKSKNTSNSSDTQSIVDIDDQLQNGDNRSERSLSFSNNLPITKFRLDLDGRIVIDEQQSDPDADNRAMIDRDNMEIVIENANELKATYRSYTKRKLSGKRWSAEETKIYYQALMMVGTNFSAMTSILVGRSRDDLKKKFKVEEKRNGPFIDQILMNPQPWNITTLNADIPSAKEKKKKLRHKKDDVGMKALRGTISGDSVDLESNSSRKSRRCSFDISKLDTNLEDLPDFFKEIK